MILLQFIEWILICIFDKNNPKLIIMLNERWNEICFVLSEYIRKGISEQLFEKQVIQVLRELGWKQSQGDFEIRPSYPIGASNRITPDIVVKSKDDTLFVIEIKQPDLPLCSAFHNQLYSYMRQLKSNYGILIGQEIQIFYDGDKLKQKNPLLLETIVYHENSSQGERFVELFSKDKFTKEALEKYACEIIEGNYRKEKIKILTNRFLTDDFKIYLTKLIKQAYINENNSDVYDSEVIDSALQNIDIQISKKVEEHPYQHQLPFKYSESNKYGVTIEKEPEQLIISKTIGLVNEKIKSEPNEAKTIDQHLKGASSELQDLFRRIDIEIMNISSKVERYIVTKEIIYNTSLNFAYLAIQKRNNCLKFYIRTSNDKMNDPKNISKPYRKDQGNITRQVNISPEEEKSGKCSLTDVMNLLIQSYDSTQ